MQLSNHQILNSLSALEQIGQASIPATTAVKLAAALRAIRTAKEDYDIGYKKVVDQFGARGEDGQLAIDASGRVDIQDMAGLNTAMNELLTMSVEITTSTLPVAALGETPVRPLDLAALDWLFVEKS